MVLQLYTEATPSTWGYGGVPSRGAKTMLYSIRVYGGGLLNPKRTGYYGAHRGPG
jgi:hypothetical protein